MLVCDKPILEKWSSDFSSSGQPNPVWTRIRHEQTVLCNSLEWAEWSTNPVQVEICDACGTVGCASGGYVHVSAFGDIVLWTTPRDVPGVDVELAGFPATAIEKFGSVAFPVSTSESLHAATTEVPPFAKVARADGRALRDAWAVGQTRPKSLERLVPMLRACVIAGDTLDKAGAIGWIELWLGWFEERAETEIEGVLTSAESAEARIEKVYFDGPGTADWLALARIGDSFVPALSPNHIFVPAR